MFNFVFLIRATENDFDNDDDDDGDYDEKATKKKTSVELRYPTHFYFVGIL